MKFPNCPTDNPETQKVCSNCGLPLTSVDDNKLSNKKILEIPALTCFGLRKKSEAI